MINTQERKTESIQTSQLYHVNPLILKEEEYNENYYHTHPDDHLDELCQPEKIREILLYPGAPFEEDPDLSSINKNGNVISDSILNIHRTDIYASIAANFSPPILHTHTYIEIIYLLSGSCTNYSGNQVLHLEQGDFLIMAPNTLHAISAFNHECRLVNLMIRTSIFEDTFFKSFSEYDILYKFFHTVLFQYKVNSYLLFHTGTDEFMRSLVIQLLSETERNHSYQEKMKISLVQMLFTQILNRHADSAVVFSDGINDLSHDVALILTYMQHHYQTLTLKELATFFGYSERQLTRILIKYTDENYRENMNHIKMRKAKQLLEETDLNIDTITGMLGYSTPYGFRKNFRSEYGITPNEYRKSLHLENKNSSF